MSVKKMTTIKMLKDARNRMISRAAAADRMRKPDEKKNWELRKRVLDAELAKFEKLESDFPPKRVFVSYSMKSGRSYFEILKKLLREAHFDVTDGFREAQGTEGNVLKIVLKQLKESTVYVAILSKEFQIKSGKQTQWAPGVWLSEEKGMALALEMPFSFLVHEDIRQEYFLKTTPEKRHILFNDANFAEKAQEAVVQVSDRYEEYTDKYVIQLRE